MKHITFYFDVISPYAFLAFEALPEELKGLSYSVCYRPVLFAALLKHHGQLGPAEIPAKRDWTYRQVLWLAQSCGIEMQMPKSHPFNPLALLRLATGCGMTQQPGSADTVSVNRYVSELIFRHVWQGGFDAADPERFEQLKQQLASQSRLSVEEAKQGLQRNTNDAISRGVFGVPAFEVDGKVFWGLDALPMLRDYLLDSSWFQGPDWDSVKQIAIGAARRNI